MPASASLTFAAIEIDGVPAAEWSHPVFNQLVLVGYMLPGIFIACLASLIRWPDTQMPYTYPAPSQFTFIT